MNYTYVINEITVTNECGAAFAVYGVDAVDDHWRVLTSYPDIFFDKYQAEELVARCNESELSLQHLRDVVEDALAEQYGVWE